jgi:hypothetical protein
VSLIVSARASPHSAPCTENAVEQLSVLCIDCCYTYLPVASTAFCVPHTRVVHDCLALSSTLCSLPLQVRAEAYLAQPVGA